VWGGLAIGTWWLTLRGPRRTWCNLSEAHALPDGTLAKGGKDTTTCEASTLEAHGEIGALVT